MVPPRGAGRPPSARTLAELAVVMFDARGNVDDAAWGIMRGRAAAGVGVADIARRLNVNASTSRTTRRSAG